MYGIIFVNIVHTWHIYLGFHILKSQNVQTDKHKHPKACRKTILVEISGNVKHREIVAKCIHQCIIARTRIVRVFLWVQMKLIKLVQCEYFYSNRSIKSRGNICFNISGTSLHEVSRSTQYLFQLNFGWLLLVKAWHRCCFKCQALPQQFDLSLLALLNVHRLTFRTEAYKFGQICESSSDLRFLLQICFFKLLCMDFLFKLLEELRVGKD